MDMWIDLLASHLLAGDPGKASNLFELPVAPQLDGTSRPQRVRNKAQETRGHSSLLFPASSGGMHCAGGLTQEGLVHARPALYSIHLSFNLPPCS